MLSPRIGVVLLGLVGSLSAHAEELDSASLEALTRTQALLQDKGQRGEALKNNQQGQALDAQLSSLVGTGADKEAIYAIAAEVFAQLVQETGGDAAKMNQILEEAQRNPEEFAKRLNAAQRAQVSDIAARAEKGSRR
jgi:hypothetical protein